jgi:hypothetical protein
LERVLRELNSLLAKETQPSLYQSALLLSWDLIEPALGASREAPVLNLLATLHFHADEDSSPFPERTSIARHWLFEKSTPQLILRLVRCAYQAGQLGRYPLLGEKAAPFLLQSFLDAAPSDKNSYYPLFAEMRLPLHMSLLERLSGIEREVDLKYLLPVLRVCGVDPSLSFQLSPWMAKGSRELKLNLISLIEEIGDPAGGPSLRVALFDDAEEIASLAARVTGKIHFLPATSLLEKVTAIRKKRFGAEEKFLISVCQALGDLAQPSSIPFLMETAKKKSVLERGQTVPLAVRLEAVQALVKINKPEVWTFVKSLMEEKNPSMEETINRIIEERVEKG